MKVSFATSRQSFFLLFIFLIIAAAFFFIYFKRIDNNRTYLIQRNFRQLNSISLTIQQRVSGISDAIKNNIETSDPKNTLKRIVTDSDSIVISPSSTKELQNKSSVMMLAGDPSINFVSTEEKLLLRIEKIVNDSYVSLDIRGIGALLESKKREELFDDFFFATNKGDTIIQLPQNVLTISELNNLTNTEKRDTSFSNLSQRDAVVKLVSGGEEFLLFIHPMSVFNLQNSSGNNRWILCGLVRDEKFSSETKAFSTNTILFFISIVVLVILAWPLLKLRFISRYGHIRTVDIALASISLMFAAAIFTFIFMDIVVISNTKNTIDNQLDSIATRMQSSFMNEICQLHEALDYETDNLDMSIPQEFNFKIKNSTLFEWMHWTDASGIQKFKRTVSNQNIPLINISKQEYFNRVMNNDLWEHKCDLFHKTINFFLKPRYTKTTGNFTLTLAKDAWKDKKYAAAVEFIPVSVYSAILPRGFTYSIIDEYGTVLFHSNKDRNLSENFFSESRTPAQIKAAMKSRTTELFDDEYFGKESRTIIKPLKNIPWSIVVMFDIDVMRRNNLENISLAIFLFALYISPFIIVVIIFILIKGPWRNWLWPDVEKTDIYRKSFYYCIFLTLVLPVIYYSLNQTIVFAASWLFPQASVLFIFMIFMLAPVGDNITKPSVKKYAVLFIGVCIIIDLTVVLTLSAINNILFELRWLILSWVIVVSLGGVYIFRNGINSRMKAARKVDNKVSLIDSARWFYRLLTAFLILGAVIPAIGFFKVTYNSQIKLYIKQAQLDYHKQLQDRTKEIYRKYNPRIYKDNTYLIQKRFSDRNDLYMAGFYYSNSYNVSIDTSKLVDATTWFEEFVVHEIMPQFGEAGLVSTTLIHNPEDKYYEWKQDTGLNFLYYLPVNIENKTEVKQDAIYISSLVPFLRYSFFSDNFGLSVLIFIFYCAAGFFTVRFFYSLIRYTVKNTMLIDANNLSHLISDNYLITKHNGHVILLQDKSHLDNKIKEKIEDYTIIDIPSQLPYKPDVPINTLLNIKGQALQLSGTIILQGFDFEFSNPVVNERKLAFLEYLSTLGDKRIIIISSVNPLGGFVCAEPGDLKKQQVMLNRWKNIMLGFIFTSPFGYYSPIPAKTQLEFTFTEFIKYLFIPEFSANYFIAKELKNDVVQLHHSQLFEISKKIKIVESETISRDKTLEETALFDLAMEQTRSYHQFLWNTCSIDEKLVLLRLARDKFVPVSNLVVVESLFQRGLIKRDPDIKPFNSFFTRFILESHHPEEDYWKKQESEGGWEQFRIPILLILTGIVIFLFTTQSEVYSSTLTIVTAVSALIPAILRLFGVFQPSQTSKSGE